MIQLIDISDDGFCSLLNDDGSTKDDLVVPEGELGASLRAAFDEGKDLIVSIVAAMGKEAVVSFKENTAK